MKLVKQKSTGKIVFREEPHGDDAKVLENASAPAIASSPKKIIFSPLLIELGGNFFFFVESLT